MLQFHAKQIMQMQIIDINGKLLKTTSQSNFYVGDLPTGIYFVIFVKKDGEKIVNHFIKN
jgi:hypothetical protein